MFLVVLFSIKLQCQILNIAFQKTKYIYYSSVLGAELVAPDRAGRDLLLDSIGPGSLGSPPPNVPPELTCISEEGGLDLDLDLDIPEHLLEDLDCGGDCITSCNKVCTISN